MCTVSWSLTEAGYSLIFNRDEHLSRAPAEAPRVSTSASTRIISPTDPEGGGSWVTVNNHGVTLCLLNDYEGKLDVHNPSTLRSRGLLVRELATEQSTSMVQERITSLDLKPFLPFVLICLAPEEEPVAFHHNGVELLTVLAPICPMTSSGERNGEVTSYRRAAFQKHLGPASRQPTLRKMRKFHKGLYTPSQRSSVAMQRIRHATVSTTEVFVTGTTCTMRYFHGHPRATNIFRPDSTLRLQRAASPLQRKQVPHTEVGTFNLGELFKEKNPELHRALPPRTFSLLALALGAQHMNRVLAEIGHCPPHRFPARALRHLGVEVKVRQTTSNTPYPQVEAPIYVANHPLGGVDGLAAFAWALQAHGDVLAPVNDILLRIPQFHPYAIGINKSKPGRELLNAIERLFAENRPLMIFPAGKTSRMGAQGLRDPEWGRMVVSQALRQRRPVTILNISGQNSPLFYRVAAIRQRLRIPVNLEMFLLPREVHCPHKRSITLTVGNTLSVSQLHGLGENDHKRAQALRQLCYKLESSQQLSLFQLPTTANGQQ